MISEVQLTAMRDTYCMSFLDVVNLLLQCSSLLLYLPELLAGSFELTCEELIDVC